MLTTSFFFTTSNASHPARTAAAGCGAGPRLPVGDDAVLHRLDGADLRELEAHGPDAAEVVLEGLCDSHAWVFFCFALSSDVN